METTINLRYNTYINRNVGLSGKEYRYDSPLV